MLTGFLLAFLFGAKHAFDADHVVAVSTFMNRPSAGKALKLSMSWSLGHLVTAAAITILLFTFKDFFLSQYLGSFEALAGIMLIALGFLAFRNIKKLHTHTHLHNGVKHSHPHLHSKKGHKHKHLLGVGIVHGLASNDELLLVMLSLGLSSVLGLVAGLLVFGLGVIVGMAGFSLMFSTAGKAGLRAQKLLAGGSGVASVLYGIFLLT